ncbi:MAG TPA: hypothetical protein VNR00_20225 [Opitutus sp.]|nr:hypothetical protein [Opitutus sp.]
MKLWSRIAAFLLLALWLPATQHCDLEAAGLEFSAHEGHASATCQDACKDDACRNVEGVAFPKQVGSVRVLPPPVLALCEGLRALMTPRVVAIVTPVVEGESSDELLVLHRTWSFVHRAALPARAPDSLA